MAKPIRYTRLTSAVPLVIARDLSVRYGNVQALAPLSLQIPDGSWALLGPNGAGKSTFIRCMLGLTRPAGGGLSVLGRNPYTDPSGVRSRVGYMPESPALLPGLSGIRYVTLAARLNGLTPSEARRAAHIALDEVGLGEARYRMVEGYSTGMRQRVKLAQAIAHDPKLLILDEPTNGLDPEGRDAMLDLIREMQGQGRHLILSSHILHEVRRVCDQAVIIRSGKVVHQGPLGTLSVQLGGLAVETLDAPQPLVDELSGLGHKVIQEGDLLLVEGMDVPALLRVAKRCGIGLRSVRPHERASHDVAVEMMEGHR